MVRAATLPRTSSSAFRRANPFGNPRARCEFQEFGQCRRRLRPRAKVRAYLRAGASPAIHRLPRQTAADALASSDAKCPLHCSAGEALRANHPLRPNQQEHRHLQESPHPMQWPCLRSFLQLRKHLADFERVPRPYCGHYAITRSIGRLGCCPVPVQLAASKRVIAMSRPTSQCRPISCFPATRRERLNRFTSAVVNLTISGRDQSSCCQIQGRLEQPPFRATLPDLEQSER